MTAVLDDAAFFAGVRKVTGSLDDVQVSVINDIRNLATGWCPGWIAYGLATAWHEARLRPIDEIGKGAGHSYGKPGKYGQAQYGRSLVQLTWDTNYEWADKICAAAGLTKPGEILANFDLVKRPDCAALILVKGMEGGHFTGVGLGRFIPGPLGTHPQFISARKIINGQDRADLIAGYADGFQNALVAGGYK